MMLVKNDDLFIKHASYANGIRFFSSPTSYPRQQLEQIRTSKQTESNNQLMAQGRQPARQEASQEASHDVSQEASQEAS